MNSDDEQAEMELRSEQAFADLFGSASPRPAPPAADAAQIRDAVHAEWQGLMQRRSRRRQFTSLALAASVLLAVFVGLGLLRDPVRSFATQQVATIGKQFGPVIIRTHGEIAADAVASINGSDIVETRADAGLELGWHNGGSLRLDENTIVVFEAVNQVYLQKGRVYFDSINSPLSSRVGQAGLVDLRIRTDGGVVQHLGTQYMLEATADRLTIFVREGEVSVDGKSGSARAGQKLAVSADGFVEIEDTDIYGDNWQWIEKTVPAVKLGGRPVSEALDWVGRETGRSIEFATPAAKTIANDFSLVGFDGEVNLNPVRALYMFADMADLNVRIDGGVILVLERTYEK
jgi:ferric-dicitrate binding protein FerR (iron transport regulator)